jgi:transcriptional regulator with XRE-family HTH domain
MNLLVLGNIIKQLRTQLGLTQSQLAEKISVTYQQIQKYEKGKSEIGISRFMQIAKALETPPNEIFKKLETNKIAEPEKQYYSDKDLNLKVNAEEKKLIGYFRNIKNKSLGDNILKLLKSISEL